MRFGRLVLLTALAAGAYYAPRAMSVFPSGVGAGSSDLLHGLQQLQLQSQGAGGGVAEPSFGQLIEATGSNPNAPSVDFKQLIEASERETAGNGPDGTELSRGLQELTNQGALKSPVLQKLAQDYRQKQDQARSIRDHVWDLWLSLQRWYWSNHRQIDLFVWAVPWSLFLVGLLTFAFSQAGMARYLGELGYGLSRNWLRILSLTAFALAISTHSNPWPLIPRALILAPMLWLLASAYILHLVDMNYPFWNATVRGCLSPLLSMAAIIGLGKIPLNLQGEG